MKFLGLTEVAAYLQNNPTTAETIRAWVGEIKHRNWESAEELRADFRSVDVSQAPTTIFFLGRTSIRAETLIDFRKKLVLLTALHQ